MHNKKYVLSKVRSSNVFKFFMIIGIIKPFYDGDTFSYLVRYWNPLSYIWILIGSIFTILSVGIPEFKYNLDGIGICLNDYYKKYPERIEYISFRDVFLTKLGQDHD